MVGKFALSLAALASAAAAVNPVSVKGSKFVDSKGSRFEMVGVAYQPGGSAGFNPATGVDPLSDAKTCLRDATIMQKMGINTIRVYNLDPNVSHDECAGIFDAAGIYMVIDVNSPLQGQSLDAAQPWTTYTKDYMTRVFQVIEAFKGYPNLVGFFAGNEVINDVNSGKIDPPYIRAVTRDMKNYIAKQSPGRAIAVGYSAADVRSILVDTSNYLQCSMDGDSKDMSKIDFFGLNSYSWCGQSTMAESGYDQLVTDFTSSTIPVFFSEYGCNAVTPRPWTEVQAIYGPSMNKVFSGALAYEYTQETNNYGLVKIASDGSAQLMQDFDNLEQQLSKINFKALTTDNSTSTPSPQKCSAGLIKTSGFNTNFTLPAVPEGVQDLINNGVKTGYKGGAAVTRPTDTKCPYAVTDSQNKPITGLAIKAGASGPTSVGGSGSSSNSTVASSGTSNSGGDKGASFVQPTNGTADHADDDGCHSTVTSTITQYANATPVPASNISSSAPSNTPPSAASNTPPTPAKSGSSSGTSSTPIKTGGAATLKAISPISILALVAGAFVL